MSRQKVHKVLYGFTRKILIQAAKTISFPCFAEWNPFNFVHYTATI